MSRLGPVEVYCDAPADEVIRASEAFGFRSPWDVRWMNRTHIPERPGPTLGGWFVSRWMDFFGGRPAGESRCPCGRPLPEMLRACIRGPGRRLAIYLLGQCGRCQTIFWEER